MHEVLREAPPMKKKKPHTREPIRKKRCGRCGLSKPVKRGGLEPHSCPHYRFCETVSKNRLRCAVCDRAKKKGTSPDVAA